VFTDIPTSILDRMGELEKLDAADRIDGSPRLARLRQIPPETGRFLALLAAGAPKGQIVEIGTSAGYSTLWLALAARESKRKVTTFELLEEKLASARETFRKAEVEDVVELIPGDAREGLDSVRDIAFCFLDAEKEHYAELYDLIVPRLVLGGLLVADNVISHAETLGTLVERADRDDRVDSVVVPIGKGELVCRRV